MATRRALFLTSQFFAYAGAEMTVLELAEELIVRGWRCEIRAAVIGAPLGMHAFGKNVEIELLNGKIDVSGFDLVWCQHGSIANIDYDKLSSAGRPLIVAVHLSAYTDMEKVLHPYERELSDLIVANSEETQRSLPEWIDRDEVIVNRNAAPATFFQPRAYSDKISSILCVTNHLADELSHVLLHFQRNLGVSVRRVGRGADLRRVERRDVEEADFVVAIGKTVQYALASRTPVYLYDHFGGDGWVTARALPEMSAFNFSGRPDCRRLSSDEIFAEMTSDYSRVVQETKNLSEDAIAAFDLRRFVDVLLERCERPRKDIRINDFDRRVVEVAALRNGVEFALVRQKYGNSGTSIWSTPSMEDYFGL
ncbi:hypothetical protein [Methylosinus sporium]|uniref:hypothetical protein n=1 Tax=Methylosinus sporium TaxID=428 RepID=UPI00383A8934